MTDLALTDPIPRDHVARVTRTPPPHVLLSAAEPLVCSEGSAQDREAWLEARRVGIGASEGPTILGRNPYKTAVELYYELTGMLAERERTDFAKRAMAWGHRLEDVIALAHCEDKGRWALGHQWLMRSRSHPFLLATPDYVQWSSDRPDPGVLETKNMNDRAAAKWELWDHEPPVWFQIQVQQQMLVLGWKWGSVAALIGGSDPRSYDFELHPGFCRTLVARIEEFWERVQKEKGPPEIDDSEETARALSHLRDEGLTVTLPEEALAWYERYKALGSEINTLKAERRGVENQIKAAM